MTNELENAFGIHPVPAPSVPGTHVAPLGIDVESASPLDVIGADLFDLPACKAEIERAHAEYKDCAGAAIRAGVALGTAALCAKRLIPHGQFMAWVADNFDLSPQWVRTCMRAAEAWQLGLGNDRYTAQVSDAGTIETLAGLLAPMQGKAPKVRTLVLDKPAKGAPVVTDVTPRPVKGTPAPAPDMAALDARAAALDRREKVLDAREKRLEKLEAELNERARLIAMREAAPAPDTPATVGAKVKAAGKALAALRDAMAPGEPTPALDKLNGSAAPDLDKARAAAAKRMAAPAPAPIVTTPAKRVRATPPARAKAPASPPDAATSADPATAGGLVAKTEKTAPASGGMQRAGEDEVL